MSQTPQCTNFMSGLDFVLKAEGDGVVLDPIANEYSKQGIRQSTYDRFLGTLRLPHRDIHGIESFEVDAIYYYWYWVYEHCDLLGPKSSICLFNTAVNCGGGTAIILLQEALQIKADGNFGPITQAAIAHADDTELAKSYIARLIIYYNQLADKGEKYHEMLKGWLNRTAALKAWIGL